MKKVLIGVGIGCGVLILVGAGLVVAGGIWAKNTFGGTVAAAQRIQAQQQELVKLDTLHPFQAPAPGEVLALDAKRLEAWLTVREEVLPVFKAQNEKLEAFEKAHGGNGQQPSLSMAVDAANLVTGMTVEVRAAYIASLTKQAMSPTEFQAITTSLYASLATEGEEQAQGATGQDRERMEQQLAELDKKLGDESLTDAERAQLEEASDQLETTLESMEEAAKARAAVSDAAKKVAAANVALVKQYTQRVELTANEELDGFLMGGAGIPEGTATDTP